MKPFIRSERPETRKLRGQMLSQALTFACAMERVRHGIPDSWQMTDESKEYWSHYISLTPDTSGLWPSLCRFKQALATSEESAFSLIGETWWSLISDAGSPNYQAWDFLLERIILASTVSKASAREASSRFSDPGAMAGCASYFTWIIRAGAAAKLLAQLDRMKENGAPLTDLDQ